MPYTPENNPYVPGDPYSYDLKWLTGQVNYVINVIENIQTIIQNGGVGAVKSVNGMTGDVVLNIPTVPTNISAFYNDVGYITLADLPIYDGGVI